MFSHRGIQRLFVALIRFALSILKVFGMTPAPIQEALDKLDAANTAFDASAENVTTTAAAAEDAANASRNAVEDHKTKSTDFDTAFDNLITTTREYYAGN